MLSPIFNLLIGRQIAVKDGLSSSEADRFGIVSMMIPNVFGLVVTKVLADKEAAANAAASAASRAASTGSTTPAIGTQVVTTLPQEASAGQPVQTVHEPGHARRHGR